MERNKEIMNNEKLESLLEKSAFLGVLTTIASYIFSFIWCISNKISVFHPGVILSIFVSLIVLPFISGIFTHIIFKRFESRKDFIFWNDPEILIKKYSVFYISWVAFIILYIMFTLDDVISSSFFRIVDKMYIMNKKIVDKMYKKS